MKRLSLIIALCLACTFGAKAQDTLVVVMSDGTKECLLAEDVTQLSHHASENPDEDDYLFFYDNKYAARKVMASDIKEVLFREEVIPVVEGAVQASCADVISGEDGTVFQVTGKCTRVTNTTYGNWYLSDGENEIYVYGTVDEEGNYLRENFNIHEGDVLTVCGLKSTYGTTVELVNVRVYTHRKSPLVVLGTDIEGNIPAEGGNVTFFFTIGNTQSYKVSFSDTWITVKGSGFSGGTFSKKCIAAPNEGQPRDITFIVSAQGGEHEYEATYTVTQDGKPLTIGTIDNPMTVEQAIGAANLGYTDAYYIKGIVSKLYNGGFSPTYHNGSFYISSDGVYYNDKAFDFLCYQVNYLDNEQWYEDQHPQIKEGDEVLIYGPITIYNGTAETTGKGTAYIVSLVPAEE